MTPHQESEHGTFSELPSEKEFLRSLTVLAGSILGLAIILSSTGCSDKRTSSTEVENELTVSVTGVAATGWAASYAIIQAYLPTGEQIAQDTTAADGQFNIAIPETLIHQEILLEVWSTSGVLRALLIDSANNTLGGDTLFALINPVTDLATRQALGMDSINPANGFPSIAWDSLQIVGNTVVATALGQSFAWSLFAQDRDYRAAIAGSTATASPCATDALLHTLTQKAGATGMPLRQYLDSIYRSGSPILNDSSFGYEYASYLLLLGVDSSEAVRSLQGMSSQQPGAEQYYRSIRDGTPPPDPGATDANTLLNQHVYERTNEAAQQVLLNSSDPEMVQQTLAALSSANRIIDSGMKLVVAPVRSNITLNEHVYRLDPLLHECAFTAAAIIKTFPPENWGSQEGQIHDVVTGMLQDKVLAGIDLLQVILDPTGNYYASSHISWTPTDMQSEVQAWMSAHPSPQGGNGSGP